jgi:uncharacterized membrane protein
VFIATFIYSLLVLRTIYSKKDNIFIPHLSVTFSIILAAISVGVLIYFIHHASTIIQASHVLENVSDDLHRTINKLYPEKIGLGKEIHTVNHQEIPEYLDLSAYPYTIISAKNGYLQVINNDEIMKIACNYNLLIWVDSRPGEFIIQGKQLARVWPNERVNRQVLKKIKKVFVFGKERTEKQDVGFPILQLVEIALLALSPGKNDHFTAIHCIDRLCAGLCHLVQRKIPSPYRYDKLNHLRVIAEAVGFDELLDTAFNEIRLYSSADMAVTKRLLDAIATIASYTQNSHYHDVLRHHADLIKSSSEENLPLLQDRQNIQTHYEKVLRCLSSDNLER